MEESQDRAKDAHATFVGMRGKKKAQQNPPELTGPLIVDEEKFTEVVRNLLSSPPAPLTVFTKGFRRKKNPETDPRKLKLFQLEMARERRTKKS